MAVLVFVGSPIAVNQLGVLVDGHKAASFSQLISYLAMVSIGVWGLVAISMVLRVLARRKYKYRMETQRK